TFRQGVVDVNTEVGNKAVGEITERNLRCQFQAFNLATGTLHRRGERPGTAIHTVSIRLIQLNGTRLYEAVDINAEQSRAQHRGISHIPFGREIQVIGTRRIKRGVTCQRTLVDTHTTTFFIEYTTYRFSAAP